MGNLAVQLKYFEPELELGDIRNIIAKSYRTELIQEKNKNADADCHTDKHAVFTFFFLQ